MENKVVLPDDSKSSEPVKPTPLDIVENAIEQLDGVLQEQEEELKKLNDAAANLQQRRIAATAQRNILADLKSKFQSL